MPIDYSKLSDDELQAIANNDYASLSDATLEALAAGTPATVPAPSEIPRRRGPSLADIGDRSTGFRQQVAATGMTPEERQAAVRGIIPVAASLAAGPLVAGAVRGAGAVAPALQRVTEPLAAAIQSGGFRTGLPAGAPAAQRAALRVAGGAISGGAAAAPYGPEEISTGAAIGATVPTAARALVEPFRRAAGPSTKEIREAAKAAYSKVDAAKVNVKPTAFNELAERLKDTANKLNFVPESEPGVQAALNAFETQVAKNEPVSLSKLDKLRRTVSRKAASRMSDEGRIGNAMLEDIDAFIKQTMPKAVVKDLEEARDLWTKMSRGSVVDKMLRDVDRAVARGQERAAIIRQKFDALRDKERVMRQFSPAEKDLINKLAEGTVSANALERIGTAIAPPRMKELRKFQGFPQLATYGGVGTGLGVPAAAGLAATGYGARALANQLAAAEAQRFAMQARTGLPMQQFAPEFFPQVAPALFADQE
jgi:hypothetical protein